MQCLRDKDLRPGEPARARRPLLRGSGVVLLVTLVLLVVLAALAYTVTSRVAAYRHRTRYLVDHARARYARDSALRLSATAVEALNLSLISRPNEPDFSDLFRMSDDEIEELLRKHRADQEQTQGRTASAGADANTSDPWADLLDGRPEVVPGPYGPPWPLVSEPIEFEIDTVQVRIEIEDENAKYPLGWMLLEEPALQRPANAGFETFCEWMGWTPGEIAAVKEQLTQVAEVTSFKLQPTQAGAAAAAASRGRAAAQAPARTAGTATPRQTSARPVSAAERQGSDLGRLVHSSLLDHDLLSRPTMASDQRQESVARYLGLWGSSQVNVNTAPRHVLEAALAFVGDAGPIADALIRERKIQPFRDLGDLRKRVTRYADALEKGSPYITFASTTFTVRITAVCGSARSRVVAGMTRQGTSVKTIGVLSD